MTWEFVGSHQTALHRTSFKLAVAPEQRKTAHGSPGKASVITRQIRPDIEVFYFTSRSRW